MCFKFQVVVYLFSLICITHVSSDLCSESIYSCEKERNDTVEEANHNQTLICPAWRTFVSCIQWTFTVSCDEKGKDRGQELVDTFNGRIAAICSFDENKKLECSDRYKFCSDRRDYEIKLANTDNKTLCAVWRQYVECIETSMTSCDETGKGDGQKYVDLFNKKIKDEDACTVSASSGLYPNLLTISIYAFVIIFLFTKPAVL